jgi:predicted kinase
VNVIIMRGLPGSGKTTWAEAQLNKIIVSADRYHMVDGEYRFDPKKAGAAHDWCLREFLAHLQERRGYDIIVDNTNTTTAEIAPYARLASAFGIPFKIVHIMCRPEVAYVRNVHKVPLATIFKMYRNLMLEEIPIYWPQEVIIK